MIPCAKNVQLQTMTMIVVFRSFALQKLPKKFHLPQPTQWVKIDKKVLFFRKLNCLIQSVKSIVLEQGIWYPEFFCNTGTGFIDSGWNRNWTRTANLTGRYPESQNFYIKLSIFGQRGFFLEYSPFMEILKCFKCIQNFHMEKMENISFQVRYV